MPIYKNASEDERKEISMPAMAETSLTCCFAHVRPPALNIQGTWYGRMGYFINY